MTLAVDVDRVGDRAVVVVAGELDVAGAPTLRQRLVELGAAGPPHLVVDLDQVELVDDVGLGVLVGGAWRSRARGGSFSVVCSRATLLEVLVLTGLDQALAVHPTLTAALQAAGTPGRA